LDDRPRRHSQISNFAEEFLIMNRSPLFTSVAAGVSVCAFWAGTWRAEAADYIQTDLVSDLSTLGASITDSELMNPWGVSHLPGSPFWVSDQAKNASTLYAVTGSTNVSKVPINGTGIVNIPTTAAGPQGPTGQVANTSSSFAVGNGGDGNSALFIFANLNGTISAWDGASGQSAFVQPSATTPGAVYTGLAINTAAPLLYAANDAGAGSINVFDGSFTPKNLGSGAFTDPSLPSGLVPFNVQDIGGKVYVTYAPSGRAAQQNAALGDGVVDVYDEMGGNEHRLITGGQLAAPWGITLAPSTFGPFGGDLLVGNFSYLHSEINAFNPTTGTFLGSIPIDVGPGNTAGGLWALSFGEMGNNGSPNTLYFTDGINGEKDGLFAALTPSVPEPSTWALMLIGLGGLGLAGSWRRRQSTIAIG
jgi:uncharacterized protein (TIGR03118 family)